MPNVRPFEFANLITPLVAVWVPAARPTPEAVPPAVCTDAVITLPDIPKVTLFELEKTTVPVDWLEPLADTANGVSGAAEADAVIVEPDIPKDTLFEFEKTTVPLETDEADAEIAMTAPPHSPASLGVCMILVVCGQRPLDIRVGLSQRRVDVDVVRLDF